MNRMAYGYHANARLNIPVYIKNVTHKNHSLSSFDSFAAL